MNKTAEELLKETAQLLDRWVREVKSGDWSTQHVNSMTKQADKIWSTLGRLDNRKKCDKV